MLLPYMAHDPLHGSMLVKVDLHGQNEVFYFPTLLENGRAAYQRSLKAYFSPADPSVANGTAPNLVISKANYDNPANPDPSGPPSGATSYAANFKLFGILNDGETAVASFDRGLTIANIPDGSS